MAAYYALFGGEYSWPEVRRIRKEVEAQRRELEVLRRQVDSLRALADSLEHDSATLERLARERFGMIRDGEVLYRLAQPKSPAGDTSAAGETIPGKGGAGRS